jgi:hypothetical protein
MKKMVAVVAGVLVAVAAVLAILYSGRDPTGSARGSHVTGSAAGVAMQKALWQELARYERSYLKAYSEQFTSPPDAPLEALAAFNELAYNVTGPGGLWRKTVPDKYFGCSANEDLPVCQQFKRLEPTLSKWDKLQEEINALETDQQASAFLKANGDRLKQYITTYAPVDESMSSVQATPFFQKNLSKSVAGLE